MILNNSGIVHCATRTRGREETAMNMQELLTYVEELTFKTSMFGYDKDEVDIQLDKIIDDLKICKQEMKAVKTLEILLLTVGILTHVASDLLLPAIFPPA